MDKCPKCGTPVSEEIRNCVSCGATLKILSDEAMLHVNLLQKKIEQEPLNVKLYMDLGDLYQKHEFLTEALVEYQRAAKIENTDFDAHFKSAGLWLKLKDYVKAESAFLKALHANPKSGQALIGLFRVYYLQKKTDEAIILGEKIIQTEPDNQNMHRSLKELYGQKGDKEKLLRELLKLESLAPRDKKFIKEIAVIYDEKQDFEKALFYYQKSFALDAADADVALYLGNYYFLRSDYDKAIEYLKDLGTNQKLPPETRAKIYCYLAVAFMNKGDAPSAIGMIDGLNAGADLTEPADRKICAELYYKLGLDTYERNKQHEAISWLEKAVAYDPGNQVYGQHLQKVKSELNNRWSKIVKKVLIIAAGAIGAVVIVVVLWGLMHNKIIFRISPADDVRISIDGKPLNAVMEKPGIIVSPTMLIGSHKVVIEKEGYEKWQGQANIGFGATAVVKVNLVPVYGTFKINSDPPGACVFLDGKLIGVTPYTSSEIPAVVHRIDMEVPGYSSYSRGVTIENNVMVDLGVIALKNLAGSWQGMIGDDAYTYDASFNMTIEQNDVQITVKYFHRPSDELTYRGKIKGSISKNEFIAEGNVTCEYPSVFFVAKDKRRVIIRGNISEDWERIEGKHWADGLGTHDWWATRKK